MMPENTTPDDLNPELLAAYADGELDAGMLAKVERWLAANPDAIEMLAAQREFGPANVSLWERAEVPEPSAAAWVNVRQGIELGLEPQTSPLADRWKIAAWALGGIATVAIAASVAWVAFRPVAPPPTDLRQPAEVASVPAIAPAPREVVKAPKPDLLAVYAVLPIASDEEVILDRVPNTRAGWLPTGRHPLSEPLALAAFEDVHFQEVEPSPDWPPRGPRVPGQAPMIFAARPR